MKQLLRKKRIFIITALTAVILFTVVTLIFNTRTEITRQSLQKIFDKAVKPANIYEAVLFVENSNGDFSESFSYGGRNIDMPMLTASVGKMFTTACILMLCEEGRISLKDNLSLYFDDEQLKGLHFFKGHDYSFELTISDLLFQTSGLSGSSRSLSDDDKTVSFAQRAAEAKNITPAFAPNKGAAYYANINFFLLGKILEKVTGLQLADVYEQMVFSPLGMKHTYLPVSENDFIPHLYYGSQKLYRPKNIISAGAAGGFVSTPRDLMAFSKGFWEGRLFDKTVFESLSGHNKLKPYFGPVYYSSGYMRISLESIYTLFLGTGGLMGHSGVTGSFAFYYPEKDLHFIGDFAQLESPSAPFKMLLQLTMFAK